MIESKPNQVPDPKKARIVGEHKYDRPRRSCAFDRTGRYLFSGGDDNLVRRWDLQTNEHTNLEGHASWVLSFAVMPSNELLLTGGYDGAIGFWPLAEKQPKPIAMVDAHEGWIRSVALSPDAKLLVTCGNDKLVKVWTIEDRKLVQVLNAHTCHVYSVAFHPGKYLVSADHLGIIRQWDTSNWKQVRKLDASPLYTWHKNYRAAAGGVRKLDFNRDGRWLAGCGLTDAADTFGQVVHPAVALFDWTTGKRVFVQRSSGDELGVAWGVTFHPSGEFHMCVCGGRNGRHLYFFKTDKDKPFHTMQLPNAARDLALHPNGLKLAVAHFDGGIRLVDLSPPS